MSIGCLGEMDEIPSPKYQRHELALIETTVGKFIDKQNQRKTNHFQLRKETRNETENGVNERSTSSEGGDTVSGLEIQAVDWSKYVRCKSILCIKMGLAPIVNAEAGWTLAESVRGADKIL